VTDIIFGVLALALVAGGGIVVVDALVIRKIRQLAATKSDRREDGNARS
jgi:hypothetical protein